MRGKGGRSCFVLAGFMSQSPLAFLSRFFRASPACRKIAESISDVSRARRRTRHDSLDAYSTRLLACAFPSPRPRGGATLFRNARRKTIYLRREHVAKELLRHVGFDSVNFIKPVRYLSGIRFTRILSLRNGFTNVRLQNLNLVKNNVVPSDGTWALLFVVSVSG